MAYPGTLVLIFVLVGPGKTMPGLEILSLINAISFPFFNVRETSQ